MTNPPPALPEIPPAHREAMADAIKEESHHLDMMTVDALICADAAIATLLQLGYRVAPGLSENSRAVLMRALEQASHQANLFFAQGDPMNYNARLHIAVARAEVEATPPTAPHHTTTDKGE